MPVKHVVMSCVIAPLLLVAGLAPAQPPRPWDVRQDVQYGEAKGQALLLDVYTPNGKNLNAVFKPGDQGKGRAIIDVISGGWNGSRARQEEHEKAGLFDVLCSRGYTVFAVRPGSLPDFNGLELVENVQRGVRWVKEHAAEHGVDPARIGMTGASAGGHLALMSMVTAKEGDPAAADPVMRHGTAVKAVAVLFPPTDFLEWGDGGDPRALYEKAPTLLFSDGLEGKTREQMDEAAARLSPARHVKPGMPPVLMVHGDTDPIVPLQQSQKMEKMLKEKGNSAEVFVKKNGGHFWLTIPMEIVMITDWFDRRLSE